MLEFRGHAGIEPDGATSDALLIATQITPEPSSVASRPDALGIDPKAFAAALSLSLIERLEQAIVVTDAAARVKFLNRYAQHLVRTGAVHLLNGRLRAEQSHEDVLLQRAIRDVASGVSQMQTANVCGHNGRLLVAANMFRLERDEPFIILQLIDRHQILASEQYIFSRIFGLTSSESQLALHLSRGAELSTCADRMQIKTSTARSHLKQIFIKTKTRRQVELVRLLMLCRPIINLSF